MFPVKVPVDAGFVYVDDIFQGDVLYGIQVIGYLYRVLLCIPEGFFLKV